MKKFKINTVTAIAVYAMLAAVCSGCHCIIYDAPKVVSVSEGNEKYKYRIELKAFPANQILYTNHLYAVGDTLTNCR